MRTISKLSNREFQSEIAIAMEEQVWNHMRISTLRDRVEDYLKKLNSDLIVDKVSWQYKMLSEVFDLPADLTQALIYEDRANVLEHSIREYVKRRTRARYGRLIARKIGLHFWPAIAFGPNVDPKAYLIAEKVQSKGGTVPPWGTRKPGEEGWGSHSKGKNHGGWDMQGHWGNNPWGIQKMWFSAGCKDSPKFRIQVAAHKIVPKRITGSRVKDYIRGLKWMETHIYQISVNLTPRALCALGRISAWARWVAVHKISISNRVSNESGKVFDLNELDWAEVSRLQKMPKWKLVQEAPYLPMRMRWALVKEEFPNRLRSITDIRDVEKRVGHVNVSDVKPGLQAVGVWEEHKDWGFEDIVPSYAASLFFKRELRKAMDMSEMSLHDLGQSIMRMPQETMRRKTASSAAWVAFCFTTKLKALKYSQHWEEIEKTIGRLPKSLEELEALCRKVRYGDIAPEHAAIADAAASLDLGTEEYLQYRDFMTGTAPSPSKCLPEVRVTGKDVGMAGDWVLESLAPGDPIGPMLGLATNCCQHLNGAAYTCAKAIWHHRRAGAWVVRYKGKIIAQSYVWSSADILVLDSVEALSGAYVEGIAALYGKAATLLTKEGWEVYIGHTGYGITREVIGILEVKPRTNLPDRCPSSYKDAYRGHLIS